MLLGTHYLNLTGMYTYYLLSYTLSIWKVVGGSRENRIRATAILDHYSKSSYIILIWIQIVPWKRAEAHDGY